MADTSIEPPREVIKIFSEFIEHKKLRRTPERIAVLEMVYSKKDHFTVEDLYVEMASDAMRVSRATVYNTLDLLLECGLVNKINIGNTRNYFKKSYGSPEHDHIICNRCKKIIEFQDQRINDIQNDLENILGVKIIGHEMIFYAECIDKDCTHKNKPN